KAEAKREITQMTTSEVDGKTEEKEEKKTITITAWYTPEIPVSHGPDDYWGLPGLILEVNDGSRMMVCNKIVLNPESPVGIELPKKGKKVTNEEFRAVMQEQTEKMNKMYGGGKKKGKQGTRISISSGQ
ncbi:MAG: GLPGLI family protein, partial [Flavobacteriaceae bacterium]